MVRDHARLWLGDGLGDYEQFILSTHPLKIDRPEWLSLPFSMFPLGKLRICQGFFFFKLTNFDDGKEYIYTYKNFEQYWTFLKPYTCMTLLSFS